MTRDYTDFMSMTAGDLAQYARENAVNRDLIRAMADMLCAVAVEASLFEDRISELRAEIGELENARDEWQDLAERLNARVKELTHDV